MSFFDRLVPIDFEFNHSKNEQMNMVSVAYMVKDKRFNTWLHCRDNNKAGFKIHMNELNDQGYIFLCHNAVAEGRGFISLGLYPEKFKWIDNFAEHRMITNHNDNMMFGNQLIKGRVIRTHRKEWKEEPSPYTSKPEHSLAATTFKMLGKSIDLDNKNETRDIIIRADYDEIEANKQRILDYGASDIDELLSIYKAHIKEYKRLLGKDFVAKDFIKGQLLRGDNMVRTALMETIGYPINFQAVKNFALHTDDILGEIAQDCNEQFPDILPFTWDISKNRYKQDTKSIKEWIKNSPYADSWETVKTGYSLAREEWEKRFGNGHVFIRGSFGSQMYRYYYTKQHMNGFQSTKGKKTTFWDSVGSDGRVRPWLNPYRAQSSRFQPSATGFIPLKAAWMRSLIQPPEGKAIAAIDYGSEEFLISALWSGDQEMIKAYMSGCVYLAFGKSAKMLPQDATKKSHPNKRQIAKAIVLGISYGLTKVGLAIELGCSQDKAQEYIDLFFKIYSVYAAKVKSVIGQRGYNEAGQWVEVKGDYQTGSKRITLPCLTADSEVYTDCGMKPIIDVCIKDLIWDGIEWVKHGGVVAKGKKGVINLKEMNIGVTPDHLILLEGWWRSALEVAVLEESQQLKLGKFSVDGQLLRQRQGLKVEGLSYVAAYVNLKNSLELMPYELGKLRVVLNALTLSEPEKLGVKNMSELAIYLMTSIFSEDGEVRSTIPEIAAKIKTTPNGKIMEVGAFNSTSTLLEDSWNTLLRWMGVLSGDSLWTEPIMMETMKLETYESLALQKTIGTNEEVYDILNCGPRNRFQVGKAIVHNCGWIMWGDNDNMRSVGNCGIQGFGASIIRKAIQLCQDAGLDVMYPLHDADYIIYEIEDWATVLPIFKKCMVDAFVFYFPEHLKEKASMIRTDFEVWGYKDERVLVLEDGTEIPTENVHVDERHVSEYEQFSKYFETDTDVEDL